MINLVTVRYERGNIGYFSCDSIPLKKGDLVLIETARGLQVGTVATEVSSYSESNVPNKVQQILRVLNEADKRQHNKNQKEALISLEKAKLLVKELNLDMRIIDSFYTFDRNQLVFTFVADSRVDFRELAKKLAQLYHTRIELRQVGVRDKAKEIGGIGPCGRFLCCSTFLTDFDSVSINMAKNQYIALNPTKINGVCGRLLCCLKYEDDQYTEMKKGLPKIGQTIECNGIQGKVNSINLLNKKLILEQSNKTFVEISLESLDGITQ